MVQCPRGKIVRKGYKRSDGVYVRPTCVKDTGKPGKTAEKDKILPKPTSGGLSKYGYKDIRNLSAEQRHKALEKGVKKESYATIVRRLNLISNYNKNTTPSLHKIMRRDLNWMKRKLYPIYSKTANR